MKKILLLIMLLIPFNVVAMSASSMVAVDLDNDYVYFDANKDDKRLIASITKIMTTIVTIENIDIDKEITVGKEVLKAYGSAIYINVGEKITIRDLLYGLIMRSGNDAAIVLAKNVAGSMEGFAHLMNELASNIGMKNSNFVNAHGLEENDGSANYSTAYDMALITKYAMNNKTFREIFGTKNYVAKSSDKTYRWTNKNKLLHSEDYITGGKTGFTKKARRTLVTTASRNNINVVVVTLNDGNDFLDHKNMYEEIFRNYEAVKVLSKDNINDTLYLDEDIYVSVKNKNKDKIDVNYSLFDEGKYSSGDVVGYVSVSLNGNVIRKENIYVKKEEVKEYVSWWTKFLRWLGW